MEVLINQVYEMITPQRAGSNGQTPVNDFRFKNSSTSLILIRWSMFNRRGLPDPISILSGLLWNNAYQGSICCHFC